MNKDAYPAGPGSMSQLPQASPGLNTASLGSSKAAEACLGPGSPAMPCLKSAQLAHVPHCHGSARATISTACGMLCHGAAILSLLRHPAWCYGAVRTRHPDCASASDGQQPQPPISTALLLRNAMACRDPMDVRGRRVPCKQIQQS